MDKNELKAKILRIVSVALPIVLVAVLIFMISMALSMARDYQAVMGKPQESTTLKGEDEPNGDITDKKNEDDEPPVLDFSSKGLSFSSNGDGTCALMGLGECTDTFIIVPLESEDGDIVVEIADSAFKNCNKIKGIEFAQTVKRIGSYAFYGSTIREVIIPSHVKEIGNYAFAGCKYLTKIEVEENNQSYSSDSGILYNKDGSTLITYPAGKTDNFCTIPKEVEAIENMAFYKCSYIKKVTYYGTSAAWRMIDIGAGNDVIEEAILYCAGDGSK